MISKSFCKEEAGRDKLLPALKSNPIKCIIPEQLVIFTCEIIMMRIFGYMLSAFLIMLNFFSVKTVFAQQSTQTQVTDSLILSLKQHKEDTSMVNTLLDISFYLSQSYPDSAIAYAKTALRIATANKFTEGIAGANRNIGLGYNVKSLFSTALSYYLKALKAYEEIQNESGIAKVKLSIGQVYSNIQDYSKAREYFLQGLESFTKLGNINAVSKALNNLGILHNRMHDYKTALVYYEKALKMKKDINDLAGMESNLSNIAACYFEMKDYEKSLQFYREAMTLNKLTGNRTFRAVHSGSIGNIFRLAVEHNNEKFLKTYCKGNRQLALSYSAGYLDSAIAVFRETGNLNDLHLYLRIRSKVFEQSGNYKEALLLQNEYAELKDSLFNAENTRKTLQMQMQYDYDKQLQVDSLKNAQALQIQQLRYEKQKKYTFTVLLAFSLLLSLGYFLFRNRNKLAKEKQRSEALLLNILPSEVAGELISQGKTKARHYDEVTVLFSDFVGFTSISEQLTPSELVEEINTCFTAFDHIIVDCKLEKIKTIGDAYMAVCGLPETNPNHAEQAVNAAIRMNNFIQDRLGKGGKFNIRIGLHTGEVVAGVVGINKFAYDIWGDAVNTASRMEQHSEPGKINLSQNTYELIKNKFKCIDRGKIMVKNKGEVRMYFLKT